MVGTDKCPFYVAFVNIYGRMVQWVCLRCHCDLLMLRSDMARLLKVTECARGCAWRWDTFLNCASVCGR